MDSIEKIHQHEKDIVTKRTPGICPRCKSTHGDFTLHERRHRLFYVIIDSLVDTIGSFLGRWKCSFCRAYLEDDTETYLGVSSAIGYTTQIQKLVLMKTGINNRLLALSTVWR